mgnify:CR=1 FL=1|jgi:hypothetical protein
MDLRETDPSGYRYSERIRSQAMDHSIEVRQAKSRIPAIIRTGYS